MALHLVEVLVALAANRVDDAHEDRAEANRNDVDDPANGGAERVVAVGVDAHGGVGGTAEEVAAGRLAVGADGAGRAAVALVEVALSH